MSRTMLPWESFVRVSKPACSATSVTASASISRRISLWGPACNTCIKNRSIPRGSVSLRGTLFFRIPMIGLVGEDGDFGPTYGGNRFLTVVRFEQPRDARLLLGRSCVRRRNERDARSETVGVLNFGPEKFVEEAIMRRDHGDAGALPHFRHEGVRRLFEIVMRAGE